MHVFLGVSIVLLHLVWNELCWIIDLIFSGLLFPFNAVNMTGKQREFGGMDQGDDQAALLKSGNKPLTQIVQDDSFREFEFRQYLFACQAKVC